MSDFDPKAYLASRRSPAPAGDVETPFDPKAYLATKRGTAPGSPLEQALAEQPGDVVTVQTPTGPAQFDRKGNRVMNAEESQSMMDAGGARLKERALEGGLSVLSGGGTMMDELAGMGAIGDPRKARPGENALATYVRVRNGVRKDVDSATRNASPQVDVGDSKLDVLPALGAAIPSMLAPVPGGPLMRILGGGATSAIDQVGRSTADLTNGEVGDFAKDVGGAGGAGLAISGLAEGLAAPLRGFGRGATKQAGLAKDAALEAMQAARDKAARQAMSALGGVASGQGNSLETVADVLRNSHLYSAQVVNEARAYMQSAEGKVMMNRAALNNLEKLANSAPREEAARVALASAQRAAQPAAVADEVGQQLDTGNALRTLGKKAWTSLGQRAVLGGLGSAAGSGVDWALGRDDHKGGEYGFGAGFLAGPGAVQFMRNTVKSPAVQHVANKAIAAVLRGSSGAITGAARAAGTEANVSRETDKKTEQGAAMRALLKVLRGESPEQQDWR